MTMPTSRSSTLLVFLFVAAWVSLAPAQPAQLTVTMVGNAGVMLSDDSSSLLIDLPYESGASGYQTYRPEQLRPAGTTVAVVTHHHRDHFAPELFLARPTWKVIGPPSVVRPLPGDRVLSGDRATVGAFEIIAIPTPHTDDHRSYQIRWHGRVLQAVGDTEDPGSLRQGPPPDVLFITPWLSCAAAEAGITRLAVRSIAYHLARSGADRICGDVEVLEQGASFTVPAGSGSGSR